MSINQHYKLSDATAVLHFIVGYNNEMEVQEEAEQAAEEDRVKQREREGGKDSKADAATRRITFLLKCEKPFAVVAVYTLCCCCCCLSSLSPALPALSTVPLSCFTPSCCCCPLYRCCLSALCAACLVLCAFLFMRLSLCLCLAVYRSLAVGTALCMQKT